MSRTQILSRFGLYLSLAAMFAAVPIARAEHSGDKHKRATQFYQQINLVSDQPGMAMLQDPNLVNAWGISFAPTSPFWVSDNGTGKSTLYIVKYDAQGMVQVTKAPLEVVIPGAGNPTGQLFNGTGGFNGDIFIFVSEDGTISGWRPALGTTPGVMAEVLVPGSDANI